MDQKRIDYNKQLRKFLKIELIKNDMKSTDLANILGITRQALNYKFINGAFDIEQLIILKKHNINVDVFIHEQAKDN